MNFSSVSPIAAILVLSLSSFAADVHVKNAAELRTAVSAAKPGTRILLAPGNYTGGFQFSGLRGEAGKPIILTAADPANPPVFRDGKTGMHISKPVYVELHNLSFMNLSTNGLNIDDGGEVGAEVAHHVVLKGLQISEVGDRGNEDGIKLSGLFDFTIQNCMINRWGRGGGSAVDMVGCHRGVVEGCTIRNPNAPNSTGVQCKGGTTDIVIRKNVFEDAGGRAVNLGGSTGLQFFRPPLKDGGEHAEARKITVEGNRFVGGMTPVAFVGSEDGIVRFNTIEKPGKWAMRILQETRVPGFIPSRKSEFTDNLIIFESSQWGEGGVNIGGGTEPNSFKFARNWWYCADRPERSRPNLPSEEKDGVYGQSPTAAKGKAGADAWKPAQ